MNVGIIDYGLGNIASLGGALKKLDDCNITISDEAKVLNKCSHLILPGVGKFSKGISNLKLKKLDEFIRKLDKSKNILGICLGMQLMFNASEECDEGEAAPKGLNLVNGNIIRFQGRDRIPHIGFNQVDFESEGVLFEGISKKSDFYFVHSYYSDNFNFNNTYTTKYSNNFLAAFQHENLFGTQFHPELSKKNGLRLLKNFLNFNAS